MYKPVIFLLLIFLLPVAASAQNLWTLDRCIDHALSNNLNIQLSQLDIEISEANLTQARHLRAPNLNGFASHNYNWGRSFDVFTNLAVTQRVQSNSFGVSTGVTLFNGFQNQNTIKQNEATLESSKYALEDAKNNTILNLTNAYLQILFNRELLDNARRQVLNSDEQLQRTEKLVSAGNLPVNNLLELISQKATNELQEVNAQNALDFSILQLKQLLQLPESTPFELAIPTLSDPDEDLLFPSSDEIYRTAEVLQPGIKRAEMNIREADLGIEIARGNYYPNITANAGINSFYSSAQLIQRVREQTGTEIVPIGFVVNPDPNNGFPPQIPVFSQAPQFEVREQEFGFMDQLREALRKSIGISMTIPIYNRHQVRTAVATGQIRYQQARVNAEIQKNQLRQDIETSHQNAVAAAKSFVVNKRRVEALQETFRVTQQRYNLGAANIVDFTIAQNNLFVAESDLLRAKYEYVFRTKILDFYMGNPIRL